LVICDVFCPDKSCCKKSIVSRPNPCRGRRYFNSEKSSSYSKTHGKWKYRYGNATVEGFYGNDTVRFGNAGISQLSVPGTIFGQAVKLHEQFVGRHIDGILGLAFASLAEGRGEPPFERAVKLGLVHPIFTIYLKHSGD
ncbi:hypothetical protein ANCCAN_08614, partial [Ancylostoma caninum]